MRAVVLENGRLCVENDYQPRHLHNGTKVKVLQAGICETDLQLVQGYMDFSGVLGHEFVGVAESGKFIGQRVAGEINCACQNCTFCRAGMQNHCPQRSVIGILNHDGAFADQVIVPEINLHSIPDNVSNDQAVFIEPLAAAFEISEQIDITNFDQIVVLGDGRLGNLCSQVISQQNQSLLVVGKHEEKLKRLKYLGIETVLLDDFNSSQCADLVVDCTGSPSGIETALKAARPRGKIVLKSTFAGSTGPNLAELVIHEIELIGSRCGPFPEAIQALSEQVVEVENLITSRFSIENAVEAFSTASNSDQMKVILEINS